MKLIPACLVVLIAGAAHAQTLEYAVTTIYTTNSPGQILAPWGTSAYRISCSAPPQTVVAPLNYTGTGSLSVFEATDSFGAFQEFTGTNPTNPALPPGFYIEVGLNGIAPADCESQVWIGITAFYPSTCAVNLGFDWTDPCDSITALME